MDKIECLMQNIPCEIDAVLITSQQNRRYYTGFNSSAGILFVTRDTAYFLIDFRYFEAARAAVSGCEVLLLENTQKILEVLCIKHGVKIVAAETNYITVEKLANYRRLLGSVELTDDDSADKVILAQRLIKTADEVAKIRAAQSLTDATLSYILKRIAVGKTEREIALDMEFFMRSQGAEAVSFEFIVVSGKNSSMPHGTPSDKKIEKGDLITMDFGAVLEGYHSDMTRTVAVGAVGDRQKRLYETVLQAQLAALGAIAVGKACKEIDHVARKIIDDAGYAGCFGHGLGHGVGIEIHEEPRFSEQSTAIVEAGMVITVEPGIYLEGEFGCRIEDMVYITDNAVENLTHSPKELIVL